MAYIIMTGRHKLQQIRKPQAMKNSKDHMKTEVVPDQGVPPVYIKNEDVSENKGKIDYSDVFVLPTIKTRYFSMLIDICVIVVVAIGASYFFEAIGEVPDYLRVIVFIIVFILYEPILVTLGSTVGQYFLNIRVRRFKDPGKRVLFHLLLLRLTVKALLGWISFITVTFNINRRAIHDIASGSIVIAQRI